MPEPPIHVARQGSELGTFTLSEADELVEAGFLHGADDAWAEDVRDWRPLGETIARRKAANADWRDSIVAGATLLSRVVGRSAGRFMAQVKTQASDGAAAVSDAKRRALEEYLPQLQQLVARQLRDRPAALAQAALQDEAVMRNIFGALHDCLPRPLARFVPTTLFVSFCMEHRHRLLGSLSSPAPPNTQSST